MKKTDNTICQKKLYKLISGEKFNNKKKKTKGTRTIWK